MNVTDILQKKVSFQPTAWASIGKEITIGEVLSEIKSNKHLHQVRNLRQLIKNGDTENYGIHKKNLPSVTFCGTFKEKRRKESLKVYNFLIVIDIDKLSKTDFLRVKNILKSDIYVFSFWESPSQNGFKGLVSLSFDLQQTDLYNFDNIHKTAFKELSQYFLRSYDIELDLSGSDTTRLCFLSFDPFLTVKDEVIPFILSDTDTVVSGEEAISKSTPRAVPLKENKSTWLNPRNKNSPEHRKTIQSIIRFLSKRNLSITNTYEEWYKVGYAIANSFTHDIGEKYFMSLCKLDGIKYNEVASKNMLYYCYENSTDRIRFNSLIYYASQKGYKPYPQRGEVLKASASNGTS